MHKRYIILLSNIFSQRDWDRFGCAFFQERGYEIIAVELADFMRPGLRGEMEHESFKSLDGIHSIATIDEMDALAAQFGSADLVISNFLLDTQCAPVYWVLHRYRVKYASLYLNSMPMGWYRGRPKGGLVEYLRLKLSDFGGVLYRLRETLRYRVNPDIGWNRLQPPTWWVRAGHFHSKLGATFPKLWAAEVVKTHSFDVEYADTLEPSSAERSPYAVFVDDGFLDPAHPDFVFAGRSMPVSLETYTNAVRNLLRRVKSEQGLDVVIALHPKTDRTHLDRLLGEEFEITRGKSAELIRDAAYAMVHCSTAVSFAALFETPVLFMTTDEIETDDYYRDFIIRLASWFGQARVNIDHLSGPLKIPDLDQSAIRDYRAAFLCETDAAPGPVWQTVAERFENSLGV